MTVPDYGDVMDVPETSPEQPTPPNNSMATPSARGEQRREREGIEMQTCISLEKLY